MLSPSLLAVVLLPAAAALVTAVAPTRLIGPRQMARVVVGAAAITAGSAAWVVAGVGMDGTRSVVATNAEGAALIGLTADRAGALLALLTALVGLVVQSFAVRALEGDPRWRRFAALTSLLTAATVTVALAATLSVLAIGWIVTGLALVALLGHRTGWIPAARAVTRTRRTFVIGDVALVVAVAIWWFVVGNVDLRTDAAGVATAELADTTWTVEPLHLVAILLVIAGACRSALLPAHRWLPSTVVAPTPVSALLHAGVVNGLGVLLIRTGGVVGSSWPAMAMLFAAGLGTAVLATSVMLVRPDVKGGLAWSTAGQMGFMAVQIAVGAFAAALFHIVGHAMYKASLFLSAGGSITSHAGARHQPHPARTLARFPAFVISTIVPAAAIGGALALFDPHLSAAGSILVVVFGWLSASALLRGWLLATPAGFVPVVTGIAGTSAATLGYIGGLTLFERFVADTVPFESTGQVPAGVLATVLAVVAVAAAAVRWLPGLVAVDARSRLSGALIGFGSPPAVRSRPRRLEPAHAAAEDTPARRQLDPVSSPLLVSPFHG